MSHQKSKTRPTPVGAETLTVPEGIVKTRFTLDRGRLFCFECWLLVCAKDRILDKKNSPFDWVLHYLHFLNDICIVLYDAGHCRKILFSKYFFGVLFFCFVYILYISCCISWIVLCFAILHHILISYVLYCGIIFDYIVFFIRVYPCLSYFLVYLILCFSSVFYSLLSHALWCITLYTIQLD